MKIYFAGSIRAGRDDAEWYNHIISYLQKHGRVLTEHIGNKDLSTEGEFDKTSQFIHDRDMDWVREADVLVAEVTQTSLGVGYEIGRAVEMKKRILCLYRPQEGKRLSAMIEGSSDITNVSYHDFAGAEEAIDRFFKQ